MSPIDLQTIQSAVDDGVDDDADNRLAKVDDDGNLVEPDVTTDEPDLETPAPEKVEEKEIEKAEEPAETPEAEEEIPPAEPVPGEEETPDDPYWKAFKEAGLDARFATPQEVFERVSHFDRYISTLQESNAQMQEEIKAFRDKPAAKEQPAVGNMDHLFDEEQQAGIREISGVDRLERIEQRQLKREKQDGMDRMALIVDEYPELKSVSSGMRIGQDPMGGQNLFWDEMEQMLKEPKYAIYEGTAFPVMLTTLMPDARKRVASRRRVAIKPVTDAQRAAARTTDGQPAPKVEKMPDFAKMSLEQQEKWYTDRNLVTGD